MIMFGILPTRKKINEWDLNQWITNGYPPVYLSMAKDDDTIPQKQYLELITSLERNHIHNMISYVESGSHGYGLGVNTAAEGWLEQAVNFNQQIDERIHDNCHRVGK
jgi:predicted esterase